MKEKMAQTSSEQVVSPPTYYVAKDIKRQLLKAKEKTMQSDQDRVYAIDGREGYGIKTL